MIKRYVRKALLDARNIDRRILFITYAGLEDRSIAYIQKLVKQYCPFERVYLQKASSAIACNCNNKSRRNIPLQLIDHIYNLSLCSMLLRHRSGMEHKQAQAAGKMPGINHRYIFKRICRLTRILIPMREATTSFCTGRRASAAIWRSRSAVRFLRRPC